jgi:hypothetical protein
MEAWEARGKTGQTMPRDFMDVSTFADAEGTFSWAAPKLEERRREGGLPSE